MQGAVGTGGTGNVLSPTQLRRVLIRLYCSKPKLSVFLVGPHGVGKSTVVRDTAKYLADNPCPDSTKNLGITKKEFVEINKIRSRTAKTGTNKVITYEDVYLHPDNYFLFYDLRLTELEPQDLMGLPRITSLNIDKEYYSVTTYAPPSWAMLLSIPGIDGILFLDEITNVQRPDVISAAYKLFLDKSSGNLRFSENVMVVSAGNPVPATQEESTRYGIANALPAPLLNRVIVFEVSPPKIEEWRQYMDDTYTKNGVRTWDYTVYEFLKAYEYQYSWYGNEVKRTQYGVYENEPTPRSFTNLALISGQLYDHPEQLESVAIGLLGYVVGKKFAEFVKSKKSVTAQELLQNPMLILQNEYEANVRAELAHAIATMYRTNKQNVINFVLTVLRNLPTAEASKATGAKDFLLTMYNSLTLQERTELRNIIGANGLLPIWNTLLGR